MTDVIELLSDAAVETALTLKETHRHARRKRVGQVRHPGEETPLWNALVEAVRPHLTRRGAKANLARVLGLPRQRIHEFITRPSAMPDAETVLHLVLWLASRDSGLKKGRHAQPVA